MTFADSIMCVGVVGKWLCGVSPWMCHLLTVLCVLV